MMSGSGSWRSSSSAASSAKGNEAQYCETICNMLTMLSCSEKVNAHRTLLAMTNSPESCQSLRRAGCIPLLIQILHPGSEFSKLTPSESHPSAETKLRASKALKNIVHFNPDEKLKRKELRVLRLLEGIREFTSSTTNPSETENKHPISSSTTLMKLSYDAEHRSTMCTLGAIHALADLILNDHKVHGPTPTDADCILTRHCSCVTLTHLTNNVDGTVNKAMLCSMSEFLTSLVSQLEFENEDIVTMTANVLRNLSSNADSNSRDTLRDALAVNGLMKAALRVSKEATLKAILSALCYLSAHSIQNKATICSTPNALNFLLSLLRRNKSSIGIVENAGGILRNISSHIAGVEAYRLVLSSSHCFEILLEHLRSSSITVVSNACGILSNLSGNEEMLHMWTKESPILANNAVPVLKSLEYSKNERISQGARAALLNLRTYCNQQQTKDSRGQSYDSDDEQPLDLTMTGSNCKPSPIRKLNPPPFLNPPIYNGSVSSTRTCPDIQVKRQKMEAASTDETFNYSHYDEEEDEEEEKNQQKDTVKTYCDEGTPGFSGSMVDLSSQAFDTFIQFQVEDTPAVFSRTSSLSSIEENQHGETRAEKIILDGTPKPVPNVQLSSSAVPTVVPKRVGDRRVMFSAEETPLMFSRSSSCGSLGSCGELNNGPCESDCVSEFSRRTSEAVSPSELPDSPPRVVNSRPEQLTVDQAEKVDFIESESKEYKPEAAATTTTTHDELKVFAMEGTPFLISTATSLSDIVGELDNQAIVSPPQQQHQNQVVIPEEPVQQQQPPPPPIITTTTTITSSPTKVQQQPAVLLTEEPDPDDPIYSDIQLLQKCIKAGRSVGVTKKPVVEEDEVDLSHLIQRGRAKLLTRSEDNLKQYTNSTGPLLSKPVNTVPIIINNNGVNRKSQSSCSDTSMQLPQVTLPIHVDKSMGKKQQQDRVTVDALAAKVSNINLNNSNSTTRAPSHNNNGENNSPRVVNDLNSEKTDINKMETDGDVTMTSKQSKNVNINNDGTSHLSSSDDINRRWTSDRPSFCASSPSLSSSCTTKVMRAVNNNNNRENCRTETEAMASSDIEQSTVDSNSLISPSHVDPSRQKTQSHNQKQSLSLLNGGHPPQVSSFINFKKPSSECLDLVMKTPPSSTGGGNNNNTAMNLIKCEMDDGGILPSSVSSHGMLSSSSSSQSSSSCNHLHTPVAATRVPNISPDSITNFAPHPPNRSSSAQSKYDKYSVKRIESPKERRKNDPDRYMTRSIDKLELKLKPAIPPKPNASTSSGVRPTNRAASELRSSQSEHSPTTSTTSLHLTTTTGSGGGGNKIPPKPPVRSTPPLQHLNTTLPRNAKLMEGHGGGSSSSNNICQEMLHGHSSTKGNSAISLDPAQNQHQLHHHHHHHLQQQQQQQPQPPPPPKLNFGGRLGNLFRKSFSKDSEKWGKKKDIWVKRREKAEKALVSPFNYRPSGSSSHEDGLNGNNSGTASSSSPILTTNTGNGMMTTNNMNVPGPPLVSSKPMSTTTVTTLTTTTTTTTPPLQQTNNNSGQQSNGKSSTKITTV